MHKKYLNEHAILLYFHVLDIKINQIKLGYINVKISLLIKMKLY